MGESPSLLAGLSDGLRLTLATALILVNAFFVAAEFALARVRTTRLQELEHLGNLQARMAMAIKERMDSYLSACQLGVTAASLGLGWVGEPAVADVLKPLLVPLMEQMGLNGSPAVVSTHVVALVVSFALITFVHIVVGEQAPKILALQRSEATVLATALPLRVVHALAFPFIWILNGASNALCRTMGVDPHATEGEVHSGEELKLILRASGQAGGLPTAAHDVVTRALDFSQRTVREIMVPRAEIAFLDTERSPARNLKVARESGFTRFPLCADGLDNVVGMIHLRELMEKWAQLRTDSLTPQGNADASLKDLARKAKYMPEQMKLSKALREFQRTRTHQAIVVDEYGSTVGLVTLEDVLEELVGPIQDEFDEETPLFQRLGEGAVKVDGSVALAEVNRILGLEIHDPLNSTLGGHITMKLGRIAQVGDRVRVGKFEVVVEQMARLAVGQVTFVPVPENRPDGEREHTNNREPNQG